MGIDLEVSSEVATAAIIMNELESGGATSKSTTAQALGECANCGTTMVGKHCHGCGQSAHIHRSLLHMVEELLHGLFHFDTKAWRTIPALILNPGQLTRAYIEGKRTSYVSPLALFLFLIFLMFFVFSLTMGDPDPKSFGKKTKEDIAQELSAEKVKLAELIAKEAALLKQGKSAYSERSDLERTKNEIRDLQDSLDKLENRFRSKEELLLDVANAKASLAALRLEEEKIKADGGLVFTVIQQIISAERELRRAERQLGFFEKRAEKNRKSELNSAAASAVEQDIDLDIVGGQFTSNRELESIPYIGKTLAHANKNPELTFYKLKKNAANLAFLLAPISLPFLWLLFAFRRKFLMFDHAVFSLYSLSFMSILLIVVSLLNLIDFTATAAILFTLAPPIHMFRQLKGAYLLGFFGTLWRTIALLFIALISLLLYAMVVTSLSL